MKKVFLAALLCLLCLCVLPGGAPRTAKADAVTPLGDFTYSTNQQNNTLSLTKYKGGGGDVVIPASYTIDGVVYRVGSIGEDAFYSCDSLTSVTFKGDVETIESKAFSSCANLASVTFEGNVGEIGSFAFSGCYKLTSVAFEAGVDWIGYEAFDSLSSLSSVRFSGDVGTIGEAFYGCSFKSLTFEGNVDNIKPSAFRNCKALESVTFKKGVGLLEYYAFNGCSTLKTVYYEGTRAQWASVEKDASWVGGAASDFAVLCKENFAVTFAVENGAWNDGTTEEKSVEVGGWVVAYGNAGAAEPAKLAAGDIPAAGEKPGAGYVAGDWKDPAPTDGMEIAQNTDFIYAYKPEYEYEDNGDGSVRITGYNGPGGDIVIPAELDGKKVTDIDSGVFTGSSKVTGVTFEGDVESIMLCTFNGCAALQSVTFKGDVESIGSAAFEKCDALLSVAFEGDVGSIWDHAFSDCGNLTSVTFGGGLDIIKDNAFQRCQKLASLAIPSGVTFIGRVAFMSSGVRTVYYGGTTVQWNRDVTKEDGWADSMPEDFAVLCKENCTVTFKVENGAWDDGTDGEKTVELSGWAVAHGDATRAEPAKLAAADIPAAGEKPNAGYVADGWKGTAPTGGMEIAQNTDFIYAYKPEYTYGDNSDGTVTITGYEGAGGDIVIPAEIDGKKVTAIRDSAFKDNAKLTGVTIPEGVTAIGAMAFQNCNRLTSATLPNSLTTLGSASFYGTALTSVTIPSGVATVGNNAFSHCGSLTSATISDGVTAIGAGAFQYSGLTNMTIPGSVTAIGNTAFNQCAKLESVAIPGSVATIGNQAFSGCTSLTSATIGDGVTEIGTRTFQGCGNLTELTIPASVTSIGASVFNSVVNSKVVGSVKTVYYEGTRAQWDLVNKPSNWDRYVVDGFAVLCNDSYTVSFKVENGAWNDETTEEKTVELSGPVVAYGDANAAEPLKLASAQIPAVGDKPDAAFKPGSWDETPDTEKTIEKNETYTYTYAAREPISQMVTFRVENGAWNDETTAEKTVELTGLEGDALKLAAGDIPAVGDKPDTAFKPGSWNETPDTEKTIEKAETYTYTYAAREPISQMVTFRVENGAWNDETTAEKTVELTGLEGDALKLAAGDIPAVGGKPADGYRKTGAWTDPAPDTEKTIEKAETYTFAYAAKDDLTGVTGPDGITAKCGQTLSDVALPAGWAWDDPTASVGAAGAHTAKATYTQDEDHNPAAGVDVTVTVSHVLSETEAVPATCTEPGNSAYWTCSGCGSYLDADGVEIAENDWITDSLGHSEETVPGKPATCTEPGLTDGMKCSMCEEILTAQEIIPALGHKEETVPGKPATCTEPGLTDGMKCSVCGEILTAQEVIPAKGHQQEIMPAVAPTVDAEGLTEGVRCPVCGAILTPQQPVEKLPRLGTYLRLDPDGVFRVYTDGVYNPDYNDLIDYDGETFLAANGVAQTQANGLALLDGQWYMLSGGRVVKEHTGFVFYDGEWFLVKNGILDQTASGLREYMGHLFLIADGRKVSDYSGLWQNSDGYWVFLAEGRVVDYTGLVQYDGAWFYVVNGKLAEDFTGEVEYDGATFNVVNGMLAA